MLVLFTNRKSHTNTAPPSRQQLRSCFLPVGGDPNCWSPNAVLYRDHAYIRGLSVTRRVGVCVSVCPCHCPCLPLVASVRRPRHCDIAFILYALDALSLMSFRARVSHKTKHLLILHSSS